MRAFFYIHIKCNPDLYPLCGINPDCYVKRLSSVLSGFLNFVNHCFESFGVIHGQIGQHLAVDFDT